MAHWGIAYASGPNYNKKWADFEVDEKQACVDAAHGLVESVKDHLDQADDIERALIEALTERYPDEPGIEDFAPWNDAFANAMRKVYRAHPEDLDVCTLFAESIMNRTPWELWDSSAAGLLRDATLWELWYSSAAGLAVPWEPWVLRAPSGGYK